MKKAKRSKAKARPAAKRVPPIQKGYHEVTPYLCIQGAAAALEFYKKGLGAKELMRMAGPDGRIGHAEIAIGASRIMLADENPAINFLAPPSRGGSAVHIHLYVKDADALAERAVKAGAKAVKPVEKQFYGDRLGTIEDPFGHVWHVATHVEEVSPKEMKRRAAEMAAKG